MRSFPRWRIGPSCWSMRAARIASRARMRPIDPVAGHVPGARSHPFMSNLDAERRFLPAHVLRERWSKTLGTASADRVVTMCGSGVTACHHLLALQVAGLAGARLYPGSWSEWIRDDTRPTATGSEN